MPKYKYLEIKTPNTQKHRTSVLKKMSKAKGLKPQEN
jgi:hypothetical protein